MAKGCHAYIITRYDLIDNLIVFFYFQVDNVTYIGYNVIKRRANYE